MSWAEQGVTSKEFLQRKWSFFTRNVEYYNAEWMFEDEFYFLARLLLSNPGYEAQLTPLRPWRRGYLDVKLSWFGKEKLNFGAWPRIGSCRTNRKIGYIFLEVYRGKCVQMNPPLGGDTIFVFGSDVERGCWVVELWMVGVNCGEWKWRDG
jgi:hypothetical protein